MRPGLVDFPKDRDVEGRPFGSRLAAESLFIFVAVLVFTIWHKWPQFPASFVGWIYLVLRALLPAMFCSIAVAIVGAPKLLLDTRSFGDFLRWFAICAAMGLGLGIVDFAFMKIYPDLLTVHFKAI